MSKKIVLAPIPKKIVCSIERLSYLVRLLLTKKATELNLTALQAQVLLFIEQHPERFCTAIYLANEFGITKPTISDTLNILLRKKLITKKKSSEDKRLYFIQLTKKGKKYAQSMVDYLSPLEVTIQELPAHEQSEVYRALLQTIHSLQITGIIPHTRMCFHCANYQFKNQKHFCSLLNKYLDVKDLQVDCADYLNKNAR